MVVIIIAVCALVSTSVLTILFGCIYDRYYYENNNLVL